MHFHNQLQVRMTVKFLNLQVTPNVSEKYSIRIAMQTIFKLIALTFTGTLI